LYSWLWQGEFTQNSISAFYGAYNYAMRDWFVGILWAVGSFLVLYRGFSVAEDWALNIAGLSAILLAINPCYCWTEPPAGRHTIADPNHLADSS